MNKRTQILIYFIFCLAYKSFCQQCPNSSYVKGEYLFEKTEVGRLCFLRERPVSLNYGKIVQTKYILAAEANGKKEKYTLLFDYDKENSRIQINFKNENSNTEKNYEVNFDPKGSLKMFKNYEANDTTINSVDDNGTIFTVNELPIPYITLNQFQLPDNKEALFKLSPIENEKLLLHNFKAKEYRQTSEGTSKDPGPIDIGALKKEISKYRDSVTNQIEEDDRSLMEKLWPCKAEGEISNKFRIKLDNVFYDYLKNVFPYQDNNSLIELNFDCDADGKNLSLKNLHAINSLPINWLEDSIRRFILPQLKQLVFDRMNLKLNNNNLVSDFNKRFDDRIKKLDKNREDQLELFNSSKKIIDTLNGLSERVKTVRTEFSYHLSYQSILKNEVWRYEIQTRKKPRKLEIVNSNEPILDELASKFLTKVNTIAKKSKYNIKRCEVRINKEKPVEDLMESN